MRFTLTHEEYIKYQTERVMSVITAANNRKGSISTDRIKKMFSISDHDLTEISASLVTQGKIEKVIQQKL